MRPRPMTDGRLRGRPALQVPLPIGGRRGRAARAASPAEATAGAGQGRGRSRYRRGLRSPRRESCADGRKDGPQLEPGTAACERAGFAPGQARSEVRAMGEEKYLPELMAEKDSLDPSFVHASRLLAEGRTGPGACQLRAGRSWGGWMLCCAETAPSELLMKAGALRG